MTANLFCWEPSLNLHPDDNDFMEHLDEVSEPTDTPRSERLIKFVNALTSKYPDLGEEGDDDTLWAAGPLMNEITGRFINMAIAWSKYQQAIPFVVATAHQHGLHCFDPQTGKFYPTPDGSDGK